VDTTLARSEGARRLGILIALLAAVAGLLPTWAVFEQIQSESRKHETFFCADAAAPEKQILLVTDGGGHYVVTLENKTGQPSTAEE